MKLRHFFTAALAIALVLPSGGAPLRARRQAAAPAQTASSSAPSLSKTQFEIIEGHFHDGLGTYAELTLANALLAEAGLSVPPFDLSPSRAKMRAAMALLPASHPARAVFERETANVEQAARRGAVMLLASAGGALRRVRHTARDYADAKAGDLRLEFADRAPLPVSVKTDKSGKVAVAEGQTPDIGEKWAARYFRVSESELRAMAGELGFSSPAEMKVHYLNVARLVAIILIRKLELRDCEPTNFSRAQVGNVEAAKHLFRQLRRYKRGNDESRVIIFDRATGAVKWETVLDSVDIEGLTSDRISFRPSRPHGGRPIASEFGIKVDGRVVVTFQVKHKRGRARGTEQGDDFGDITTRLQVE
jgi:hypothetical protein